ncbi:MAG: MFS transporter [Clostridia bacterium]|nr:MFS transporter [Clostridia bacterium]
MNKKLTTYVCFGLLVLYAISVTVISPLLTEISDTYSLSMTKSGLIFTVNFVGFITFVLIGGILADKFGKKKIISLSMMGFTAAIFVFPLAPDFYWVLIAMFFIGGFGGIMDSMASALVTDLNREKPSFYLNLAHVFFGVGAIMGPVAAGVFITYKIKWQVLFFILAILSCLFTIVFMALKVPESKGTDPISWAGVKGLVKNKGFLAICLCMFLYTGAEVGSWGWMSTFLKESAKFDPLKSSIAVAAFWLSITVGRIACGFITLRFKLRSIITVLAFLSAAATFLSGWIHSESTLWIIIILMGLTYSSQWPLIVSYGSSLHKTSSGTVFSLLIGSGAIGTMVIPFVMGVIGENISVQIAMASPAVLLLVLGFIFVGFKNGDSS